jgi:hypothetical protein
VLPPQCVTTGTSWSHPADATHRGSLLPSVTLRLLEIHKMPHSVAHRAAVGESWGDALAVERSTFLKLFFDRDGGVRRGVSKKLKLDNRLLEWPCKLQRCFLKEKERDTATVFASVDIKLLAATKFINVTMRTPHPRFMKCSPAYVMQLNITTQAKLRRSLPNRPGRVTF